MEHAQVVLNDLIAHDAWIRSLACRLVRDEEVAEDLAQDAWLVALEHRPRRRGALRGWLGKVVRNLARMRRRADARRTLREEGAARTESLPSVAELLDRENTRVAVGKAVISLEEPYRSAILYRYYESLPPREIAGHLGVTVAAVETRLRRGLEKLRARLDREFGDRRSWCAALLPLIGQVPTGAATVAGASATTASIFTGALVMSTKLKIGIGIAAVLVAATAVGFWPRGEEPRPPQIQKTETAEPAEPVGTGSAPVADLPARTEMARTPREAPVEPPATEPQAGAPTPKPAASTVWVLMGEVEAADIQLEGAISIEITGIRFMGHQGASLSSTCTFATPFAVDFTPVVTAHDDLLELDVRFDHSRYLPSTYRVNLSAANAEPLAPRRVIQMYIRLHRAAGVIGVVRSPTGQAAAGVDVAVFAADNDRPEGRPVAATRTDEAGRYRLRVGTEGRYLVAALDAGEHRPAFAIGTATLGRDTLMPDLVLTEGVTIAGTIRVAGKPAANAQAAAYFDSPGFGHRLNMQSRRADKLVFVQGALERATARAATDARGRYRIGGLGRVAYRVLPSRVRGLCSGVLNSFRDHRVVVAPAENVDFDLAAVPVTIEVRAAGKPVRGADMLILGKTSSSSHSTDGQGRMQTALAAETEYEVEVSAEGFRREKVSFTTGPANVPETRIVNLGARDRPGALRLTVQTSDCAHPAELSLLLERPDKPDETTKRRVVGEQGRFLVENLEPGSYRITAGHALSGGGSYYLEATIEVRVQSGETTDRTIHLELGGRIRIAVRDREGRFVAQECRVVDANGLPVKLWFRLIFRGGGWGASTHGTDGDGPAETYPPLPAGAYRVEFLAEGNRVEKAITVRVEAGKTADVTWTRD